MLTLPKHCQTKTMKATALKISSGNHTVNIDSVTFDFDLYVHSIDFYTFV